MAASSIDILLVISTLQAKNVPQHFMVASSIDISLAISTLQATHVPQQFMVHHL